MTTPKKDYYAPMHTVEHILNRTMIILFDCKRAVNCHIEKKKSKCDFFLDKEPSLQEINQIETKVNEVISRNLNVTHKFVDYDDACKKFVVRVNKEDNPKIRITSIGDYDDCPCIGEHVKNTSEIGNFKITTTTYDKGRFRIRYKIIEK